MSETTYQRIRYPDVGESVGGFENYKVFLKHWDSLGEVLRDAFEVVRTRGQTRVIALHGEQGIGKTIFAERLEADLEASASSLGRNSLQPNPENLWHRISGGSSLSESLIRSATNDSVVHKVIGSTSWVGDVAKFVGAQTNRVAVVIADNAESEYFRQGLVDISLADYMDLQSDPRLMAMVAQKLVAACRTRLRSSLILLLTNSAEFADSLQVAVDASHKGLMTTVKLPAPLPKDKETIVRVNVNRLNEVSYWFCIDRAGPSEKISVYNAIKEAPSFRDAFGAIDAALNSGTRAGRPANKNLISLIVMQPSLGPIVDIENYATLERVEFSYSWASSYLFASEWAEQSLNEQRTCRLLESEWQLRIVTLGEPFVKALLSGESRFDLPFHNLIEKLKQVNGPGTQTRVREQFVRSVQNIVDRWPDVTGIVSTDFWTSNQNRSTVYEPILAKLLPGYNSGAKGFLNARPDYIVRPFVPCSVLTAQEAEVDKINASIKRSAHVFEFTATKSPTIDNLAKYLRGKLPNYVEATREQ